MARASEQLFGTQHPVDQAVGEGKMLAADPIGTIGKAAKQAAMMPVDLANRFVRHPIDTAKEITGGPQFAEDMSSGNYAGALGTLAGGVAPIFAGSPEAREAIAEAPGKVADVASGAKESVGNMVRTPEGKLKPIVHQGARIAAGLAGSPLGTGGTIVGGLAGPAIADAILPQTEVGQMARDTTAAVRQGRAAKIPTRMRRTGTPEPISAEAGQSSGSPDDLISRMRKITIPGEEPTEADVKRAGDFTQAPLAKLQRLAKFGDKLAQNEINRRLKQ